MMAMAAWCLAASAQADSLTSGSQLADACDGQPALVSGYVAGWLEKQEFDRFVMVNTMRNHMDDKRMRGAEKKMRGDVCMRASATLTQATEAFCRYLKDDPAAQRQSAGVSLAAALSKTWPCPDSRDN
jgi:hypothetical protein